jgi:hypothetical protein
MSNKLPKILVTVAIVIGVIGFFTYSSLGQATTSLSRPTSGSARR